MHNDNPCLRADETRRVDRKFALGAERSQEELKGFARTIAEIEWLLLILVLLFQLILSPEQVAATALSMAMFFYAAFILLFRYVNFFRRDAPWKLALEIGMMIVFITWVLYYTGRLNSPLENLYILVVIASSLMLGRMATVAAMALIAVCYVGLGYPVRHDSAFQSFSAEFLARFAPLVLVAYVTTMLSADMRNAITKIKTLSETDDLTGILNRRAFLSVFSHTFNLAQRYGRSFSVVMIDSDSLKKVNDAHGHEAGDELLKAMVRHAQTELRRPDLLARYGGDEFVLLLPDTPADGARLTAERIRERIANTPLVIGGREIHITASMGIATFPDHGKDYETVFEAAAAALYKSKTAGKNRVTIAEAAPPGGG
jgi:diguanylate cyclase (GGDEF)-like protein